MAIEPKPTFSPEHIRDISEKVYRIRLDDSSGGGEGAVARLTAKHGEGYIRRNAAFYDTLTRAYLKAMGIEP